MTEETFQTYLREHEDDYARDRTISDNEGFEEALRTTRKQHEAGLPHGLRTSGNYFFTVQDQDQDRHVGYVWFSRRPPSTQLYLCHILINQADRRKGYGGLVLSTVEDMARDLGYQSVLLNVFGHNQGAIDFYLAQGYHVASTCMNKFLDPACGRSVPSAIKGGAKELGCKVDWQSVRGHDPGAIDLYRAQGYRVGALHMTKFFDPT